jgi:hypothetical protein
VVVISKIPDDPETQDITSTPNPLNDGGVSVAQLLKLPTPTVVFETSARDMHIQPKILKSDMQECEAQSIVFPSPIVTFQSTARDFRLDSCLASKGDMRREVQSIELTVMKPAPSKSGPSTKNPNRKETDDELLKLLDELSAQYDDNPSEDLIQGNNVSVDQCIMPTDDPSEEFELVIEEEEDEREPLCFLCFVTGHSRNECRFLDLDLRSLPENRELIKQNRKRFYETRPEIRTKRSRGRRVRNRVNRARTKLANSSGAVEQSSSTYPGIPRAAEQPKSSRRVYWAAEQP